MMVLRTGAARALWMGLVLTAAVAVPALAQSPTPEGTEISNTATVSYTDANDNAYADVSATVTVTVGFQAGVQVTGGETDTPAPGSTGQTMAFTIENLGNGTDQFQVSETNTNSSVMDVTGYVYSGTTYATLAALNTALLAVDVTAGGTITVTVQYDVPAGTGGQTATYTMAAVSNRDSGVGDAADSGASTVTPSESYAVSVTPDGTGSNVERLPSNGTVYSYTFSVTNNGTGSETFDLSAPSGTVVTVSAIEVDGAAATDVTLAAGASKDVVVEYTVVAGAAGATENLTLTATAGSDATVSDAGYITVERVKAALAITKKALDASRSGEVTEILPGAFLEYEVTVTNNGSSDAASVVVTDEIDGTYLSYVSSENTGGDWASITTGTNGAGNTVVTATLTGALAPAGSATFYIRVQVQ